MHLLVLGINHTTAGVSLREKVAFAPETMVDALDDACQVANILELAILSTCNRTELIAVLPDGTVDAENRHESLTSWLANYHHTQLEELSGSIYALYDSEAIRHLMQVASGLDSMILGEPQILGQMKSAFAVAKEAGTISTGLSAAFDQTFSLAKRVRTDTAIGENPVSVAYAAVRLSGHIFSDLATASALLVGAGETVELVARHLIDAGVKNIVFANRTLGHARKLAEKFSAEATLLSEIPQRLVHADIVISSTASQLPILGKGAVEQAMKQRKHKPMLMIDIAVPRDIEEQVSELSDVYLYSVDDLKEIIDENRRAREDEARKADVMIEEGVTSYLLHRRSLNALSTLKAYRNRTESFRDEELERARRQLVKGESPDRVLQSLARNLTNKLMHGPSIALKEAGAGGRTELLAWAQKLFELKPDDFDESENS